MGTLQSSPVWERLVREHDRTPDQLLERFGWDKNTTPAQLQAAVALADYYRKTYLVDRHDEIAAGFGEIAERLCSALECLDSTLANSRVAKSVQNIAEMLDLYSCGRPLK